MTRLLLRDFRSYERADVALGEGLTVVYGRNGAGKTNLLEALYFGCTGRSCRTANEREMVRFGATATRVAVHTRSPDGEHELTVGFEPGQPKRMRVDGAPVERLTDGAPRPLVSVFLPDRLQLVKGRPGLRRAHLDQVVAAAWPVRAPTRRAYAQALAQRNAMLARVRNGLSSRAALDAWDQELARHAVALTADRAALVALLAPLVTERAGELGLDGELAVEYHPRSDAATAQEFAAELTSRREAEIARGLTGHGPHRDELALLRDGRELRAYGSQGEQRLALLSLLLAERALLADMRGSSPLMLLDDVMSELDGSRRAQLVSELSASGQSVITATELAHVPASTTSAVARVAVTPGVANHGPTDAMGVSGAA